jgi:hypothetical protein
VIRSVLCLTLLCTLGACHPDVPSTDTVHPPAVATRPPADPLPAKSAHDAAPVPASPQNTAQPSDDAQAAVTIVHDYYRAISAHDFERAYHYWDGDGPPGQTLAAFTAGFADTASVEATTEKPSRIEPAMGSRYIEVPTAIAATTKDGHTRQFVGTYTLRRTVVDGAPASARTWHLYRASMRPVIEPPAVPQ